MRGSFYKVPNSMIKQIIVIFFIGFWLTLVVR